MIFLPNRFFDRFKDCQRSEHPGIAPITLRLRKLTAGLHTCHSNGYLTLRLSVLFCSLFCIWSSTGSLRWWRCRTCRQLAAALTSKAITLSRDRWSKLPTLNIGLRRATPEVLISTRSFSVLQQPYESCPLRGTPICKEITAAQVGV